jgi:hypothetical protein
MAEADRPQTDTRIPRRAWLVAPWASSGYIRSRTANCSLVAGDARPNPVSGVSLKRHLWTVAWSSAVCLGGRSGARSPVVTNGPSARVTDSQAATCRRFGAAPVPCPEHLKVGVSKRLRQGHQPIHGLRHPVTETSAGWYLWADEELSPDPDFFAPLHAEHLATICPQVLPYLALPAGWRFFLATGATDVWYDATLRDA